MAVAKRKPSTSLVYNPSRGLSIGGQSTVRKTAARKNPVSKTALVENGRRKRRRSVRRRNNPATHSALLVAAVMAGVGVTVFDLIATRVFPQSSVMARVGVKFGGAWFFQSSMGSKIPLIGKYKNDVALVLAVAGAVDLLKLYVLPLATQTIANVTGGALQLIAPPQAAVAAGDGTTGNIYGNARNPQYGGPRVVGW